MSVVPGEPAAVNSRDGPPSVETSCSPTKCGVEGCGLDVGRSTAPRSAAGPEIRGFPSRIRHQAWRARGCVNERAVGLREVHPAWLVAGVGQGANQRRESDQVGGLQSIRASWILNKVSLRTHQARADVGVGGGGVSGNHRPPKTERAIRTDPNAASAASGAAKQPQQIPTQDPHPDRRIETIVQ